LSYPEDNLWVKQEKCEKKKLGITLHTKKLLPNFYVQLLRDPFHGRNFDDEKANEKGKAMVVKIQ
jgi:hypothetical protein